MKPKEKASQLVNLFAQQIGTYNTSLVFRTAKGCALKCVDEIIASDSQFHYNYNYWLSVKKSIETL